MTDQADRADPGRRRRATRKRRPSSRPVLLACLVLVLVVAAAAAWVGLRGLAAKRHLDAAQATTTQLRHAVLDGASGDPAALAAQVRADTSKARSLTHDPVWAVAAHVPVLGRGPRAVATTTDAVDDVARDVLPTLVDQADALSPSKVRVSGSQIDLAPIAAAAAPLAAASTSARAAAAQVDAIDTGGLPGRLAGAVTRARTGLDDLATLTTNAADATRLLPPMLGADGPRRYFVAFQTNAEARATGGLVGAYGVLEADQGRLRIDTLGSRSALDKGDLAKPALDFGADYRSLYGDDPGLWVNANLSPHFPFAAQLWLAMYEKQTGTKLDGAVATDPVALARLLAATGPTTLDDGTVVTAANSVRLTESDVYARIPDDDVKRDLFLQAVARSVLTKVFAGAGDPSDVAHALGDAAGDRRLLVYSADPAEQAVLEQLPIGGSVRAEPGPNVGVFVNNGAANKLDYYLDAAVRYALVPCTGGPTRASTVTMTFANAAPPSGLPPYVTAAPSKKGDGTNLDLVAVHLPVGASVASASIDGAVLAVSPHRLVGRPVVTFPVELAPGARRVVTLRLTEPASAADPALTVQALARPVRTTVSPNVCRP